MKQPARFPGLCDCHPARSSWKPWAAVGCAYGTSRIRAWADCLGYLGSRWPGLCGRIGTWRRWRPAMCAAQTAANLPGSFAICRPPSVLAPLDGHAGNRCAPGVCHRSPTRCWNSHLRVLMGAAALSRHWATRWRTSGRWTNVIGRHFAICFARVPGCFLLWHSVCAQPPPACSEGAAR